MPQYQKPPEPDRTLTEIYDADSPTGTRFVPRGDAVGQPGKPASGLEFELSPDGSVRVTQGRSGISGDTRKTLQDRVAGTEDFLRRMPDLYAAAEAGLGITGVVGEAGAKIVGQLPEHVRNTELPYFGGRIGDLAGDTTGVRTKLKLAREEFVDILNGDKRILKDKRQHLMDIWPSDGVWESPETARDALREIELYLTARADEARTRLGGQSNPRSPAERKVGDTVTTDKGTFRWTGTGWLPAN